ncbi:helix-turn-helix domain-containing protein [Demequina sp. SYSU T00192]|uniref:Helix-turn-helix domain-containing protein n=1 Tax=Demequina litoralis TaxID=3051660 RepID=A0ABT8G6V0_9MICO|nr:TetR/AcrR family transcriptional regulator [Demequina sp. SYSU T00192]MDN4474792.1 helix-turn-helix domain-containing protein [Demequina sp. SYSU T00192]
MATKSNRGPGAAAENRAALVAAARDVFAEQGVDGPISAVARRAGVGQASLYRHFPSREDLAFAVFEENLVAVESLAADPGTTLRDLTDLITFQIEGSAAVISYFAREDDPLVRGLEGRIAAALAPKVDAAHEAGTLAGTTTVADVLLAVGMLAALVARVPADQRHARVEEAWALLMRGLGPAPAAAAR